MLMRIGLYVMVKVSGWPLPKNVIVLTEIRQLFGVKINVCVSMTCRVWQTEISCFLCKTSLFRGIISMFYAVRLAVICNVKCR